MTALRWFITGIACAMAGMALYLSWITQTRYQGVRKELDQHMGLINSVVSLQEKQGDIDTQLIATDRSLVNAIVGKRKTKTRELASNR